MPALTEIRVFSSASPVRGSCSFAYKGWTVSISTVAEPEQTIAFKRSEGSEWPIHLADFENDGLPFASPEDCLAAIDYHEASRTISEECALLRKQGF